MLHPLVHKHQLISDQISPPELSVVLTQFEQILQTGVEGAVVEFGCFAGTTSLFIRRLLDMYPTREFHVYDSFEGLPPKAVADENAAGIDFRAGELAVSKRQFLRNFIRAGMVPPVVHKGWFNVLKSEDIPALIACAFLDGDFYDSILTSLELVWPRLAQGAVVLVHDYQRETLPGVARAIQEFDRRHGVHQWQAQAHIAITVHKT